MTISFSCNIGTSGPQDCDAESKRGHAGFLFGQHDEADALLQHLSDEFDMKVVLCIGP